MQALRSARSKIDSALDEYIHACLSLYRSEANSSINSLRELSKDIEAELDAFAAIQKKTYQAEGKLKKGRNSLFSVVPINTLPNEVLLRMFHWVMNAHSLDFDTLVDANMLPVNNLAISQVCSRWRFVSLGATYLWSHIDLSGQEKVVALRKAFASRAGHHPLSVRVVEPFRRWESDRGHFYFYNFLSTVAPRMESLEFAWVLPPPYLEYSHTWFRILQHAMMYTTDKLTTLSLSDRKVQSYNSSAHWFLTVDDPDSNLGALKANDTGLTMVFDEISEKHYDAILGNVKVLRLDIVYPKWTSKAYHGLTELRLNGPRQITSIITIEQIASILVASPKLRVLHLGVEIHSTKVSPTPVHLTELEEFLLQSLSHETQQAILQLIIPGQKPLAMATTYSEKESDQIPSPRDEEFSRFFERANIVRLYVHSTVLLLSEPFLDMLPNIQTLILRGVRIVGYDQSPCPSNLSALHFINCAIDLETITWMLSARGLREVTILDGDIIIDDSFHALPSKNLEGRLVATCPVVRFVNTTDHTNIEGWDGDDIAERIAISENRDHSVD
ncbi:hypothetical protein RSOLAG1IB_10637 [Rhizoctonia solani AG-1 IB]|uniref:Uncharacterized protein n=1 Tax=Thanatephorus cucumeris (strain AG1-IB / isolate 7/3/14) TaxID=1108050 RepID=A0A0B7G3C0_THACB|nr:hypothetical protein RSOLAG1IB_10637 [Rhizoctonia solani AG-1 IB]